MRLTNPTILSNLIFTVDSSQTLDVTLYSCFSGYKGYATLDFMSVSGKKTHVLLQPQWFDSIVDHTRFVADNNRAVWSYVAFLVYRHCLQYRCRIVKISP